MPPLQNCFIDALTAVTGSECAGKVFKHFPVLTSQILTLSSNYWHERTNESIIYELNAKYHIQVADLKHTCAYFVEKVVQNYNLNIYILNVTDYKILTSKP